MIHQLQANIKKLHKHFETRIFFNLKCRSEIKGNFENYYTALITKL